MMQALYNGTLPRLLLYYNARNYVLLSPFLRDRVQG